jgi:hypothetical protein
MKRAAVCQVRFTEKVLWNTRKEEGDSRTKKSGLKAVTLIAALNPVSQVLW